MAEVARRGGIVGLLILWCCQGWSWWRLRRGTRGYRYRIEVIGHAVWLYHRFALSRATLRN